MAIGTVESIDPVDATKGTIKEEQTEQVYPYDDAGFPALNLAVGAFITYEIDYSARTPTAYQIAAYVPVSTDIIVATPGPLFVHPGETMTVKNGGSVNGAITVSNGNLIVQGTGFVTGDVTVNDQGSVVARNGGNVNGAITVNSGSALKVVNTGKVNGVITVAKANRVIIGNANGGGTVVGSLTVDKIRKVTITPTSKFNP